MPPCISVFFVFNVLYIPETIFEVTVFWLHFFHQQLGHVYLSDSLLVTPFLPAVRTFLPERYLLHYVNSILQSVVLLYNML